jgi:glycosyltransferase involved in cell wall biosynthesis
MPHFKSEQYLFEAASSILVQETSALELKVVDDDSGCEHWLQVLKPLAHDPRLSLYRTSRNVGPYRICNRLLADIASPLVGFQDADDISHPTRFSRQIELMKRTGADIVGSSFVRIDGAGRLIGKKRMVRLVNLWRALGKTFLNLHPTTLARRQVFDALGGFDGTTRIGADTDFIMRATYLFRVRNTREFLYRHRLHSASLSQSTETGFNSDLRARYRATILARNSKWKGIKSGAELREALRAAPNDVDFQLERVSLR